MRNALLILIIGAIAYTLLSQQKKKATLKLTGSGSTAYQNLYNMIFKGASSGAEAADTQYYRDAFEAWDSLPQADKDQWFENRTLSA